MQYDQLDVPVWEKQRGDNPQWFAKYLLYRNMKAVERSLLAAYNIYQHQVTKGPYKPYKSVPGAWKKAFDQYEWKARAECYDQHLQAEQEAREAAYRAYEDAERERLLSTGLALAEKRVEALEDLYELIEKSFYLDEKLEYKFVTPDKIREARGCLDDIAKEVGGRVKKDKLEHSGSVEFRTEWGGGRLEDSEEG